MVKTLGKSDKAVEQVAAALEGFQDAHPDAECAVYRYYPASIRVKVVDAVFHGKSRGERHDYARQFLNGLPEDVLSEISILLCLEPGESSMLDAEFHEPSCSQL